MDEAERRTRWPVELRSVGVDTHHVSVVGARARWWRPAAIAAQLGEKERAVNLLGQALSHGLLHGPQIDSDYDFAPLRNDPPFQNLIEPKG